MSRQSVLEITGDSALARTQAKSYEWYTPAKYVNAARSVMGRIDLDPASTALANTVVQASTFYDEEANGLDYPWPGRVWLNPPYCRTNHISNQEIWSCRLIAQYEAGITTEAILLTNASTEGGWFQRLWDYPICFARDRVFFNRPGRLRPAKMQFGTCFVYLGPDVPIFIDVFRAFGRVVRAVDALPPRPVELWDMGATL